MGQTADSINKTLKQYESGELMQFNKLAKTNDSKTTDKNLNPKEKARSISQINSDSEEDEKKKKLQIIKMKDGMLQLGKKITNYPIDSPGETQESVAPKKERQETHVI